MTMREPHCRAARRPADLARARGPLRGGTSARARGTSLPGLGDEDTATLEFDMARAIFEELGAKPDAAHVASLTGHAKSREPTVSLHVSCKSSAWSPPGRATVSLGGDWSSASATVDATHPEYLCQAQSLVTDGCWGFAFEHRPRLSAPRSELTTPPPYQFGETGDAPTVSLSTVADVHSITEHEEATWRREPTGRHTPRMEKRADGPRATARASSC